MLLTLLSLVPLLLTHTLGVSLACLCAGFFFAEMTIGPMWAVPMDIAPEHSGTASGMMNTGSALAAIISPVVSGFLIDRFGNWELPFLGSMGLMGIGMLLALRMRPDDPFTTPGLASLRNAATDSSGHRPFSDIPTRPAK
jgi:MFS family permease